MKGDLQYTLEELKKTIYTKLLVNSKKIVALKRTLRKLEEYHTMLKTEYTKVDTELALIDGRTKKQKSVDVSYDLYDRNIMNVKPTYKITDDF